MIKLIEDIINRSKLNKFQKAMLIYLCILFTLLGINNYFQNKKFNQRVEEIYNTSLNDSVLDIQNYAKTELKLWLRNDSTLIISPSNPIEKKLIFNTFKKGYNKISKKEKSTEMIFSNGIDSVHVFLKKSKD